MIIGGTYIYIKKISLHEEVVSTNIDISRDECFKIYHIKSKCKFKS